jgi:hypothetical protein
MSHRGIKLNKTLYGADSPGNIEDQPIKAPRGSLNKIKKIAKYIAKYVSKDMISKFNRKRYWPSKGIDLPDAKRYYLSSLNQADAIREALDMLGLWNNSVGEHGACPFNMFRPSESLCWIAVDPVATPPPPF